jgi:hypothetical protein
MNPIRRVLDQSGINASSLDRIRLARGVVGKASYVAVAAVLALGGIAWGLRDPIYLLVVAVLIVLVFAIYFSGTLWFANRHPGVALLEGAELIQWRQMDIAAKTISSIENKPVSEPDTPVSER